MLTTRLARAAAVSGLLATALAAAQPRLTSPTPSPPPSTPAPSLPARALPPIESRLEAGYRVVARWDLPPDRSGVPIALAQVVRSAPGVADEVKCVVAWLRDGALQVELDDDQAFVDTPAACLSAGRLGDRWVIARWRFGGYGDGPNRVNESAVSFHAIIDGQLREVGGTWVDDFTVLRSSEAELSIRTRGGPDRRWVWSPDRTRLVAAARPAPPARRAPR